jgi:hypothetical protein
MTNSMLPTRCDDCGAPMMALASRGPGSGLHVREVCSRCPLGSPDHGTTLWSRWWAWLVDHGVDVVRAPFGARPAWWAPQARALLVVTADLDPRLTERLVRRGVAHATDVIVLGATPDDMHVALDNHIEGTPQPERPRMNQRIAPIDDPALAGWCSNCGVFQWHSQWGWWVCRACGVADGDQTLEQHSVHVAGVDGWTPQRCGACTPPQ